MDEPHSGGNVMEALVPHGAGASYVKMFRRKLKKGNLLDKTKLKDGTRGRKRQMCRGLWSRLFCVGNGRMCRRLVLRLFLKWRLGLEISNKKYRRIVR